MKSWIGRRTSRWTRALKQSVPGWLQSVWFAATIPFRWLSEAGVLLWHVAGEWWGSRHWRRLLWGSPSVLVTAFCLYVAAMVSSTSQGELAQKYLVAARSASRSELWHSAMLYYERAVELGMRDKDALFDLVIAADKAGDSSRKLAVLERLAPNDRAVHAPAHLWKAVQLLGENPVPPEKLKSAEQHLRFAIEIEPENANAHSILGEIYYQRGFMEGAAHHLAWAPKDLAHPQLLRAKACVLTDKRFEAQSAAAIAEQVASASVGEDPANETARLELGEALLILEKFESAVKVLSEGVPVSKDPKPLHTAIARVYLEWANSVLSKPGNERLKRMAAFQLVSAGMQFNPDDTGVFDRMMELVSIEDETSEKAREFLLDNIATGRAVGLSHLMLGTSLQVSGKDAEAGFHLEQAFRLMPNAPIVANNLAWYLVHADPPQTERAMQLISEVIRRFPDTPAYIDTRGQVYLRMKEWEKAVDDFQISLSQFSGEPSVHEGLTEAYEHLNRMDLADRHRALAKMLKEKKGSVVNPASSQTKE